MLFRILVILLLSTSFTTAQLHAEFILDDFDDSAEAVSPEMENEFVTTQNVGELNAVRNIRIAALGTDPVGRFDTDVNEDGVMTARLDELNRTDTNTPLLAFQFNYDIAPTDISEAGKNNAILFDFLSIEANESPTFLRVNVRDASNLSSSFETHVFNLPLNSGPFVATMPFDSFTNRGGSPGLPDFTNVDEMDFDFFFLNPSETVQWSATLERIRFGQVPEPGSQWIFLTGVIYFTGRHRHRRRNGLSQPTGG